ncbi:MAG: DUF2961 domain-containing protein [Comamonadaceae bacterium]|nr:DUF2961 domain-containing protein [Comamonadaceae bacterium]
MNDCGRRRPFLGLDRRPPGPCARRNGLAPPHRRREGRPTSGRPASSAPARAATGAIRPAPTTRTASSSSKSSSTASDRSKPARRFLRQSGPGVNPYENLFFTVDGTGRMTSRLPMPFAKSMDLRLNEPRPGPLHRGVRCCASTTAQFTPRDYHLRAQWRTLAATPGPPFDTNVLDTTGEGKVVGTVYEIANDGLIWWGEGDQKISIDGEPFPSTFGTGTEDDYGYAYGDNRPFTRPYHAQTRVDGPGSGGHISLNRLVRARCPPFRNSSPLRPGDLALDAVRSDLGPSRLLVRSPGSPGPAAVDPATLAPVDLGVREDMLEPLEGEALRFAAHGRRRREGTPGQLLRRGASSAWRDARPGARLEVHFTVAQGGAAIRSSSISYRSTD